jgi:hypothetical protein
MLDRRSIAPIAGAALLAAVVATHAQSASKFPDWSGQWNRVPDGDVPRYDPTKPIRKQQAPLKPEYQALFEASVRAASIGLTVSSNGPHSRVHRE